MVNRESAHHADEFYWLESRCFGLCFSLSAILKSPFRIPSSHHTLRVATIGATAAARGARQSMANCPISRRLQPAATD